MTEGVEMLIVPMLVLKPFSKAFNYENCLQILLSESKESSETFQEAWDCKFVPPVKRFF